MNNLIWQEINSKMIPGLVIQELPPITKPKIRTQITEIDGKDGDFVDELGFGSYQKEIKIGLLGNYDVNQIAKYFTGSGQVIFSNEPDKYYNAAIYEQIDFERLINLKEAVVKFYCQPYKYLVDEPTVDVAITDQTSISVTNQGLEPAKPIITLYGTDVVEILINGLSIFQLNFSTNPEVSDEYLTVDSELQECYKDTVKTLKNRSMTGEFPNLNPGENIISWTGSLTEIKIKPKSRWL
jgi:phage-related protein